MKKKNPTYEDKSINNTQFIQYIQYLYFSHHQYIKNCVGISYSISIFKMSPFVISVSLIWPYLLQQPLVITVVIWSGEIWVTAPIETVCRSRLHCVVFWCTIRCWTLVYLVELRFIVESRESKTLSTWVPSSQQHASCSRAQCRFS